MPSLTTLPPEILNLILAHLTPATTANIPLHFNYHPYAPLNALCRTCRYLHPIIRPLLFAQYIRRSNGDDIGLIHFVRSLLKDPELGRRVVILQIDDLGCISPPQSHEKLWKTPRAGSPLYVEQGDGLRQMYGEGKEGWECIPGCERSIDAKGRGTVFARAKRGWGSFSSLAEESWLSTTLMDEKEWAGLDRKVHEVCTSRSFSMGKGRDLKMSAMEWGRKMAAKEMGTRYYDDGNPKMGIRSVETEDQGVLHEKLHVTLRFGLKFVKREAARQENRRSAVKREYSGDEEYTDDELGDDDEGEDGWRMDEVPYIPNPHTGRMVARRWLRALRRGSRDAWSALLLVLAPGTRKLIATEVNWFARPDPHDCDDILDAEQVAEVEARYEEEDEEWHALGGYTWVGRVLWQCAADQSFQRAVWELQQEKVAAEAERGPSKKRKRADPRAFGVHSSTITPEDNTRILPNIQELILGSSTKRASHPNLSLNTLLCFLQPSSITHATIYGLSNATFGLHERKPPEIIRAHFSLRFLILKNCNASAECLGYLLNKFPHLQTLAHRGSLRKIYTPSILPNLVPGEIVGYLADYCPWLRSLDLDVSNRFGQHALDTYGCDFRVESFKRLERLEWLNCRIEHLVGSEIGMGGSYMYSALQWEKAQDEEEGLIEPLVLSKVLPMSLRVLTIGVDNEEYVKVLGPLVLWVEGMGKRMRGGRTKLELVRLMCSTLKLREKIMRDDRMARLSNACLERGIGLGFNY